MTGGETWREVAPYLILLGLVNRFASKKRTCRVQKCELRRDKSASAGDRHTDDRLCPPGFDW
jgi:hypothetical protein